VFSPINQNLILYNCTKLSAPAAAAAKGLVERGCGDSTRFTLASEMSWAIPAVRGDMER
jgi:hypothetical protein